MPGGLISQSYLNYDSPLSPDLFNMRYLSYLACFSGFLENGLKSTLCLLRGSVGLAGA